MKYANIKMYREGLNNLGDNMQLIALTNLLGYMNVKEEEIVRIDYYDLSTYDGEYVILPINYPFYGYRNELDITMFSPKIIPVFLGLSLMSADIQEHEINYLKNYEPIGCRDEYTMNQLREKGITAYLNGCVTVTFPKVYVNDVKKDKIFFVDIPDSFMECVPQEIKNSCERITQMVYHPHDAEVVTKELYQKYIDEAKFVVTTRLHCAVPCLAAGIPVILVKDTYSFRFPWLNKLLPIYTKEEYNKINWNPQAIDYEELKSKIIHNDCKRMEDAFNKYSEFYDISYYFEDKEMTKKGIVEHADTTIAYIKQTWKLDTEIEYAFWGITQPTKLIYNFICKNYPNAKLTHVFDKSQRVEYCGEISSPIEEANVDNIMKSFVFVTSASAYKAAESMFAEIKKENYYQCSGDKVL